MPYHCMFFAKVGSFLTVLLLFESLSFAHLYGEKFCKMPGFHCIRVGGTTKRPQTWDNLWPDKREQTIVKKLNRLHVWLVRGTILAVPNGMNGKTHMDFAPFPKAINAGNEKLFVFDPKILAWAAYDAIGNLVNWGPALGGKKYCEDTGRSCRTPPGAYEALAKRGFGYRSTLYPIGCKNEECSWMPYYIKVRKDGLGIHGSKWFIGRHTSHGCVRLFIEDARWLNKFFIDTATKEKRGTKIIFRSYPKN